MRLSISRVVGVFFALVSITHECKERLLRMQYIRVFLQTRENIQAILDGSDDRLVCIVGPCSIHDPEAAMEYGICTKVNSVEKRTVKIYIEYICSYHSPSLPVCLSLFHQRKSSSLS